MSIFWLPAPMVAVWRVSGMWGWGSVVGSLVCGPVVCVVSDMWRVSGIRGSVVYLKSVVCEINGEGCQ